MAETNTSSMASIYSDLIKKRQSDKEAKEEQKRLEKEAKKIEKEGTEEDRPKTKKEKRQAELDAWKEIIIGLTGEDLDYVPQKKNKRKYKKWIGDETDNVVLTSKPSRKKKKNYNKEFASELNMLKTIVTDQNKFTADLQKRYQNMAGPNTKESMPLNKTHVELAAVINNARNNSLGLLREIGNIKKTIADLYMKQKKLDAELGGGSLADSDLGLMGSSIANSMFNPGGSFAPSMPTDSPIMTAAPPSTIFPSFDPSDWSGDGLIDDHTRFENIDKSIVVEWHQESDKARFKAIRNDTGEELIGCPVPTCSIKAIDPNNKVAKDDFDQVYKVEII